MQHRERSFGWIRARGVPELDADRSSSARWNGIPELPRRVGALADAHAERQPAAWGVRAMQGWDAQLQSKSEWDVLASPRRRTVAELGSPTVYVRTARQGRVHEHDDAGAVHADGFHEKDDEERVVSPESSPPAVRRSPISTAPHISEHRS